MDYIFLPYVDQRDVPILDFRIVLLVYSRYSQTLHGLTF
jgi:hypothetical protein